MQNEKKGNENLKELKDEILRLNKKNDFLILNLNQIHSKHNKLSIQAFNQLHNLQSKFKNNEKIKS